MPILDGYRSTYLIRNEEPYASIPGMRAVPIVAMTASAIRGDRERCREAGMDDYLAKPVKAKNLEQMLVKWALNIRKGRRSPARGSGSNRDSAESDPLVAGLGPSPPLHSVPVSPSSMEPPTSTFPIQVAEPTLPSKTQPKYSRAATMTGSTTFHIPSAFSFDPKDISRNVIYSSQSSHSQPAKSDIKHHFVKGTSGILGDDNGRGMQRGEAEEKAAALRNDKLILTADETHPDRQARAQLQRDHRANGGTARTLIELHGQESGSESVFQLTEENVGRWEREHGGSAGTGPKDDENPAADSSPERDSRSGAESNGVDAGGSIDADRSSGLQTPDSRATRAAMVRMESQLTVTPSRRSKGRGTKTESDGN